MARLPQPGGDSGNWGSILNDYLSQAHKADGLLKDGSVVSSAITDNAVTANALAPNSVTNIALAPSSVSTTTIADGSITNAKIATDSVSINQLQPALRTEIDNKLTQAIADAVYAPGVTPSNITGTHIRGYDRRLSIYNLKPAHLRKTRAQLAKARLGTGLCRIACDGDSTFAGEGGSPRSVNSIPSRLQDLFIARGYPLAGTGAVMAYNGASGRDDRLVAAVPANWAQTTSTLSDGTVIDSPLTFTSNRPGTIIEIGYFSVGTAGTYEVVIDGAAPETINVTSNAGSYYTYSKTGLPDTTHTVVLTKKSGGNMRLANLRARRTTGVEVSSWGIGGSKAVAWGATAAGYNDMNPIFGSAIPPSDLRFANHFLNDVTALTPLSTFKSQWQVYINRVLTAGSELVLICNHRPGGSYLNTDIPYRIVLYELADENDLPLVDLGDRLGTFTQAQTQGHMSDSLHAGPVGYFDEAQALFNIFAI